jgi:pimeloyl-ACP methyl ester carboxylesterase
VRLVLIPGWNEGANDLRVLIDGRGPLPGFTQRGFDCRIFSDGHGGLGDRAEQFEDYINRMKAFEPDVFPIVTLGYSAGGLVTRAHLRAYPERSADIAATCQVGTPNYGIVTDEAAMLLGLLRVSHNVIQDLDVASDFMTWLNMTSGHWEPIRGSRHKRFQQEHEPWIAPAGARILNIVGRMPHHTPFGDGVVFAESASLEGRLPNRTIDDRNANHLNLTGMWNMLTLVLRQWHGDDRLWPQVVGYATAFFRNA